MASCRLGLSQHADDLLFTETAAPHGSAPDEEPNLSVAGITESTSWFVSLDGARVKMEEWRKDYTEVRPHSSIGNKPPIELMNGLPAATPG